MLQILADIPFFVSRKHTISLSLTHTVGGNKRLKANNINVFLFLLSVLSIIFRRGRSRHFADFRAAEVLVGDHVTGSLTTPCTIRQDTTFSELEVCCKQQSLVML